jgi:hypothetical protein
MDLVVSVLGGVAVPMALVGLVAAHYASGRPAITLGRALQVPVEAPTETLPPLEPLRTEAEAAEVADKTAWLAVMAEAMTVVDDLTGGELVPADEPTPEMPDDAIPVDMLAVFVEQDLEEGREFVAEVEAMVGLETAVTFGYIRLEGVGR